MPPTRIDVAAAAGAYPIVIGPGALASLPGLLDHAGLGPRRIIVSSPLVWKLHGEAVRSASTELEPILVADGERHKTSATVGRVYDSLVHMGADRATVIIAMGGGVIGDLVGFAAATYLRGVRIVHVPTTLMAQVDSAVGGKTGINHALGKNLIGAFHPPRLVLADPLLLATLPRREFRAGLYEVIKYGIIASPTLFEQVASSVHVLFARDQETLAAVVAACCRIKAAIVSEDEREGGRRRILNFGHTVGHAIEAVTKYRRLRHGEAVGYGMLAAMALGADRGITPAEARARVAALVATLGPLPPVADLSPEEILAAIAHDKKVVDGRLHFVAATGIGTTTTLQDVTVQQLRAALAAIGIG